MRQTLVRYLLALAIFAFPVAVQAAPLTKVTFLTDWKAQAEHGGFYQAKALGIYAQYGLDVTIRSGGAAVNPPQLIAAGAVDFAMGSNGFQPLNLLAAGADVQAVAAIFQKDPQVLITHPRTDIRSLSDMKGKPISVSSATISSWWHWAVSAHGFDQNQIRTYSFNLAPFLVNKDAIQQGYISSEPYLIEKEGKFKPQVFLLADAGYPGYSNLILARGKDIRERPQIVKAFVAASVDGWRAYLNDDPAPGNALILRDNPEMSADLIANGIAVMNAKGIVLSGDAKTLGIGAMTDARWAEFFRVMAEQKVYDPKLDYRRAYSLAFLPAPAKAESSASKPGIAGSSPGAADRAAPNPAPASTGKPAR